MEVMFAHVHWLQIFGLGWSLFASTEAAVENGASVCMFIYEIIVSILWPRIAPLIGLAS